MDDLLAVPFRFVRRPGPVPASLRPEWRIAAVLLTLRYCWANKATRRQLHVMNWALRTPDARQIFRRVLDGTMRPDEAIVRFDPAVERALQFAKGEALILAAGEFVALTPRGDRFVDTLLRTKDCMDDEKAFLKTVGKLSQRKVNAFFVSERP